MRRGIRALACITFAPLMIAAVPATPLGPEAQQAADYSYIQHLISTNNYSRINDFIDSVKKSRPVSASGYQTYSLLLEDVVGSVSDFTSVGSGCTSPHESSMDKWREAYPNSSTAYVAHARWLINKAWCWRGTNSADSVPQENMAKFMALIDEARRELDRTAWASKTDPEWYVTMELIATCQSWSPADFERLVLEGTDRFPSYYRIYNRGMMFYEPKWNGSKSQMTSYARRMATRSKPALGDEAFAHMYMAVYRLESLKDYAAESVTEWPHIAASMDAIYTHYPTRQNAVDFGKISCYSGDVEGFVRYTKALQHEEWADELSSVKNRAECELYIAHH